VQLADIARTSGDVAATSARRAKIALLAECLRQAGPDEAATVVSYLSGELPQRQIGVGYASLREPPPPAAAPALTVAEVDAAFTGIGAVSGKGSVTTRRDLLRALLSRATKQEQDFLIRLLAGELRQGALDGVLTDAVAAAAGLPATDVRRAVMLRGALGPVATVALTPGPEGGLPGLRAFGLQVGRPVKPMLAQSAPSVSDALSKLGVTEETSGVRAAVEWKLDGIRIQAHVLEGQVRLFTRTLDEITDRLPEVVAAMAALPVRAGVFDGEVIALREDGRPHPFQVTGARTATRSKKGVSAETVPLSVFLFDVLHLDGEDLLDRPGAERQEALAGVAPEELRTPRLVTGSVEEAADFFGEAVARGHEGVMVKSLDTPYTAGRRGAGWIKVKPRHTLDLVVLAAEWGNGRRRGWLSNLHLGARDPETGGFVMLGKTFKGLTDELLAWQTERFQELAVRSDSWAVHVRPELVVEIAFDGVQRSSRYPGGMALRFARVLRYRPDKTAAEADTVETVRTIAGDTLK
jgi:DNA ligase-1